MAKQTYDRSLLEAALLGYQTELLHITGKIDNLQRQLGHKRTNGANSATTTASSTRSTGKPHKKHRISAEGKARIAEAQRKRWANVNAQKQAGNNKRTVGKTRTAGGAA